MKIEITIPDTPQDLSSEAYHSTPYDQAHPGDKRRIHVPQYAADRAKWAVWKLARSYVEWVVKKARSRDWRETQQAEFMLSTYTWAELDIIRDILTKDDARYKGAPQKSVTDNWT